MIALATAAFARFRTSTIEVDALEKRYTVETLEALGRLYPEAQLVFVMGTDMFQEIDSWKDYRRLFDLAHVAIVNRPGFPLRSDVVPYQVIEENDRVSLPEKHSVFYLPFISQPISSTGIRNDCRKGLEVQQWLPPLVWSYIEKNKLYS
jgi:nicotinate-nucleotide adenylyltransferase